MDITISNVFVQKDTLEKGTPIALQVRGLNTFQRRKLLKSDKSMILTTRSLFLVFYFDLSKGAWRNVKINCCLAIIVYQ